jgi:hypothetical protein
MKGNQKRVMAAVKLVMSMQYAPTGREQNGREA